MPGAICSALFISAMQIRDNKQNTAREKSQRLDVEEFMLLRLQKTLPRVKSERRTGPVPPLPALKRRHQTKTFNPASLPPREYCRPGSRSGPVPAPAPE